MKKIVLLVLWSCTLCGLGFSSVEPLHHDLAWLGRLKLPQVKTLSSGTLKVDEPNLWQSWRRERELSLKWLPQAKLDTAKVYPHYRILLNRSHQQEGLTRKEKRRRR